MAIAYSTRDERTRYRNSDRGDGRAWEQRDDRQHERGMVERAGDEMRSWFGDEEAERRRRRDEFEVERRERQGGRVSWPASSTEVRAGHVMTRKVTTVTPYDSIERAARLMRDCDCGALPVVNREGRLIGVVTDRDVTMRLVARGVDIRHAIVADCMTTEAFACHVNDPLEDCLRQMARHQVRRLPIVNDYDQVIGILSQADLARHAEAWQGRGRRQQFAETVSEISAPSSAAYR
jgi:CBS-domain-containing membrane protein